MRPSRALAPLVAVALAGCAESVNPLFGVVPGGAGYTDAGALMTEHVRALEAGDLERYARVLADDFEFVVRPDVAGQFPWLENGAWSRDEELRMIGNMMDPAWSGESLPVQAIEADLVRLLARTLGDGTLEWTYQLTGTVLVGDFTGWAIDARLIVHIVTVEDGTLRIARIAEDLPGPGRAAGELTWGGIKAKYRGPERRNPRADALYGPSRVPVTPRPSGDP